jgi:hypothetical protein
MAFDLLYRAGGDLSAGRYEIAAPGRRTSSPAASQSKGFRPALPTGVVRRTRAPLVSPAPRRGAYSTYQNCGWMLANLASSSLLYVGAVL